MTAVTPNPDIDIRAAVSPNDIAAVRDLFVEYAEALNYETCFDGFAEEISDFPGAYGPPRGVLLIACRDGQPVGAVGLWPHEDQTAEMKRLYVRPEARGLGLGRRLAVRLMQEAERRDYHRLELETLPQMMAARTLYQDLGFMEQDSARPDGVQRMILDLAPF